MIGAGYEGKITRRDIRNEGSKGKEEKMITVLGSILTLERSVLEQREFVEQKYREIQAGIPQILSKVEVELPPKAAELQKRKRHEHNEHVQDVVYVAGTSEESESEEEIPMEPKHKRPKNKTYKFESFNSNNPEGGKGPRKRKPAKAEVENDSEVEITAYYKINPNDASLRESDGLDYGEKFGGKKFDGFNGGGVKGDKKKIVRRKKEKVKAKHN